jgi:hypothetical protein
VRIPKHARKELEAYLECGLLCRGFARLRCQECGESRLVALDCWSHCTPFALPVRVGRFVYVAVVVVDSIGPDRKAPLAAPELDGVGADAES